MIEVVVEAMILTKRLVVVLIEVVRGGRSNMIEMLIVMESTSTLATPHVVVEAFIVVEVLVASSKAISSEVVVTSSSTTSSAIEATSSWDVISSACSIEFHVSLEFWWRSGFEILMLKLGLFISLLGHLISINLFR